MFFVYIVRCKNGSLYTGFTRNIQQRIYQHNSGFRGAKSVRGKTPVKLVYLESCKTINEALRREREIKGWRKDKKEQLIRCASSERSEEVALKSEALKRV